MSMWLMGLWYNVIAERNLNQWFPIIWGLDGSQLLFLSIMMMGQKKKKIEENEYIYIYIYKTLWYNINGANVTLEVCFVLFVC